MWYCDIQLKLLEQYWNTLGKSTLFLMWYCDIVIFWQKNHEPISQYHTGCNIVIFNQNGFSRISQYHKGCDIVIFNKNGSCRISKYHMGCDIVIFNWKSESNKDIILGCILFLMWYRDIVIF